MKEWLSSRPALWRPLIGITLGLLIASVLMAVSGFHPGEAYSAMWTGATGLAGGPPDGDTSIRLGSGHINLFQLAQSLARVTPLIFTGLAVAIGLNAGMFNIGAQGQMTVGALAAAVIGEIGIRNGAGDGSLNPAIHIAMVMVGAAVAGGLWGALAGALKTCRGVHEVISTIMLNFIALDIVSYLVTHSLHDPEPLNMAAESSLMAKTSWLWPWITGSSLTAGLPIAIILAVLTYLLVKRTSAGFQIRAVGKGIEAARANGVNVNRVLVLTMALSGAIAGLAGAIQVMGVHHRYVGGVAGTFGFDGIAVALLGNLSGPGVVLAALFFGSMAAGSGYMESVTNVPSPISEIVQASVILLVGVRFAPKIKSLLNSDDKSPPDVAELNSVPGKEATVARI